MKRFLLAVILALALPIYALAASSPQLVPFQMVPDNLGHTTTQVAPAPRYVTQYVLANSVARSVAVPTGANWVKFMLQGTNSLWVNFSGGTAVVPSGDISQGSGCIYDPGMTYIGPVYAVSGTILYPALTTISVISDSSTSWTMTAMWYR